MASGKGFHVVSKLLSTMTVTPYNWSGSPYALYCFILYSWFAQVLENCDQIAGWLVFFPQGTIPGRNASAREHQTKSRVSQSNAKNRSRYFTRFQYWIAIGQEKKNHTGYLTFEIGPHGVLTQSLYPNTECLRHVNNTP